MIESSNPEYPVVLSGGSTVFEAVLKFSVEGTRRRFTFPLSTSQCIGISFLRILNANSCAIDHCFPKESHHMTTIHCRRRKSIIRPFKSLICDVEYSCDGTCA